MRGKITRVCAWTITVCLAVSSNFAAGNPAALTFEDFIERAAANDTAFETILIDQLPLPYRREILLPDRDLILDVKSAYHVNFARDDGTDVSVSLDKLFPYNGTELTLSYEKSVSAQTGSDNSNLQFLLSQPIAKNAFGKSTRMLDRVIGIENEISRFQIVEAYEDYLAGLASIYYDWYSAYEDLKTGRASLKSGGRLMDNILERRRQKIALPIDVHKMELLLLSKKENVVSLQEVFDTYTNLVVKSIHHDAKGGLVPVKPQRRSMKLDFEAEYERFVRGSRTGRILQLLEEQGGVEVARAADDLLPSTRLLIGYDIDAAGWGGSEQRHGLFAGLSLHWPIDGIADKAKYRIARIEHKKTMLSNQNKHRELHAELENLFLRITQKTKLIDISDKKLELAASILKDEAENYSYGKVTLNDYLDAVNRVDEIRFTLTERNVELNKLQVEWLRLTDRLVDEAVLERKSATVE